ncbi:unnamed protein product [Didymodactylos carnosus]|uniref:Uncharacterized protein n=1 Tax=Didymodactylos carnosus TaxID=1234261 RepID=A0A814CQF5_9BILA|nr:unnamed protein product [Didymodactylos carnosus]CAF0943123.1 unnamed protein product [Didymodactylos carnosus]CAF3710628.1 unnamed protein product [Didymodactylos carnosus]CAF3719418.1 unnamed protein product [Didymodactylos carnosus]
MIPAHKQKLIDEELHILQLSFGDPVFFKEAALLLTKWRSDPDLVIFSNNFETTWINDLRYWYEGAAMGVPSTNNGLESRNSKIKEQYALRVKLKLFSFLPTMQQMLSEWSSKSTEDHFIHFQL